MSEDTIKILAHGGAGSNADHKDGAEAACNKALEVMRAGQPVLDCVCEGVVVLENDGRFNAGVGSRARSDGSVQMDAACMDSERRFGSVAVVEGFRHPVMIAKAVTGLPHRVLAGRGAEQFASAQNMLRWQASEASQSGGTDTVGCVAYDGQHFAAALSTGGTGGSLPGRVGDVPQIGCGLYAGPYGAVCATGHGEAIALNVTAFRAYQMMEEGMGPNFVLEEVLEWFEEDEDIGLLLISRKDSAGGSNRSMAWASLEESA